MINPDDKFAWDSSSLDSVVWEEPEESMEPALESLVECRLTSEESIKSREVARQLRFDYP